MELIIFAFALVMFYYKKFHWVLVSIFIFASSYLEINYGSDITTSQFIFRHQLADTGIILYVLFFYYSAKKYGLNINSDLLSKIILIFFGFLFTNGIIDIINNVSAVDVIKYMRLWIYLSIIWIKPEAYSPYIDKMLRILVVIIFVLTVLIIFQNITGNYWFARPINDERGIKPSFYVLPFIPIILFDALQYRSILWKWILIGTFMFAILINLKMTYFFTVILSLIIFVFIFRRKQIPSLIGYGIFIIIGGVLLISTNDALMRRIQESSNALNSTRDGIVEDNASYRLLHAQERFAYIMENPKTALRGIGFIHEQSFNRHPVFSIGLIDKNTGNPMQLDTGDIAWSLFFIRLGLFGIILFIIMYVAIIQKLYRQSQKSLLAGVYCAFMIVALCFTSLGNAVIAAGYFYLIPLMLISAKGYGNENLPSYFFFHNRRRRNHAGRYRQRTGENYMRVPNNN